MSSSRARVILPVILLLIVVAVVGGLLVGRGGSDDAAAPSPTTSATATVEQETGVQAVPDEDLQAEPPATAAAPDLTRRLEGDPMALGPADAPVGIVVYSDFSCPYCQRWAQDTQPTIVDYAEAGTVRLEWRDVAILGEDSQRAAVAAAAAAQQGGYWEFHELLFADLDARSPEALAALAGQAGLDVNRFTADLESPAVLALVQQNMQEAQSVGLQSTPSFLVAGTPVVGAQPTEVFVELIEAELDR